MSNPSTTESWRSAGIGLQPGERMPTSVDDIMEITDDMLMELSPEDRRPPPPPIVARRR